MAKKSNKKTHNKEFKPEIQDKKEVLLPSSGLVTIKLYKDNKIHSVDVSVAKAILQSNRGEYVEL